MLASCLGMLSPSHARAHTIAIVLVLVILVYVVPRLLPGRLHVCVALSYAVRT